MAIAPVSQNFYTKKECVAITAVAYCGLALILIGIISQNHLDIFSGTQLSRAHAITCMAIGGTLLSLEVIVLLVKKYLNTHKKEAEQAIQTVTDGAKTVFDSSLHAYDVVASCCHSAAETFHTYIGKHVNEVAKRISLYLKGDKDTNNVKSLFFYIAAWGAIAVGFGLLHGFQATALPLTIGMAGGCALGIVVGIITVKSVPFTEDNIKRIDPKELEEKGIQPHIDKYSLWGLTTIWLDSLDANGTKMIIQTVLVTVLMTFTPIFPVPAGVLIGGICGNFIAIQIVYWQYLKDHKPLPKEILNAKRKKEEENQEQMRVDTIRRETIAAVQSGKYGGIPLIPHERKGQ